MIYAKIEKDQIKTKKNLDLFRILYHFWTMNNVSKFWEKFIFLMVNLLAEYFNFNDSKTSVSNVLK